MPLLSLWKIVRRCVVWTICVSLCACRGTSQPRPARASYPQPQVSGELTLDGLHASVRVVRDRWGIPHIYASNQDDLFFAQGFVQAQDRLFQMDLWRRSVQGRLAEVLGPNFIERDMMTRRVAYRGDMTAEWASYAPDAKAIGEAFVRGVNARVAIAQQHVPEAFVLAGWKPETWAPEDLLARAEAFSMSENAFAEIFRARVINAVGPQRAATLLPLDPPVAPAIPHGLDTHDINDRLADALRSIAAPPFFMGLSVPTDDAGLKTGATAERWIDSRCCDAPLWTGFAVTIANAGPKTGATGHCCAGVDSIRLNTGASTEDDVAPVFRPAERRDGSNNWVVAPARSDTGAPIVANDPHRALDHPSLRYLVHLSAPGWNVEGAVVPWLPGVAIGHNDRVGWGLTIFGADVQDLYVERVNPANPRQVREDNRWVDMAIVRDTIRVRGRSKPFEFERQYTRHGVIVAVDREKHLAFALRWTGSEPGTAGYFAALSLDRARTADEFRDALRRWKMPGENFVYADADGRTGYQAAALVPVRQGWNGTLPVPGWSGEYEWRGWIPFDTLPRATPPSDAYFASANNNTVGTHTRVPIAFEWGSPGRINRINEVLEASPMISIGGSRRLQKDVTSWNAEQLVPLLDRVHGDRADVEDARERLRTWNRQLTTESAAATLYVLWERALGEQLVSGMLDRNLAHEYLARVDYTLVPALTSPSSAWFGPDPVNARDALLVRALGQAVDGMKNRQAGSTAWGELHTATFRHVLAITDATRRRFNIGPFQRPGYGDTVNATYGPDFEQTGGASFREILDLGDWDRSIATSAPGQSESPSSPHFADLAKLWAEGEYFPLAFGDAAVQKNAETTLVLRPR